MRTNSKMFKAVVIGSVLFAAALAIEIDGFENNLVEYDIPAYVRRGISLPYVKERVIQPGYYSNVYKSVPVVVETAPTEVGLTRLGFVETVASFALSVTKAAIGFLFVNGPALVLGTFAAFGLCKFTPICLKLSVFKSLVQAREEIQSFATPERIARAADFVQKAVEKYNDMQKNY